MWKLNVTKTEVSPNNPISNLPITSFLFSLHHLSLYFAIPATCHHCRPSMYLSLIILLSSSLRSSNALSISFYLPWRTIFCINAILLFLYPSFNFIISSSKTFPLLAFYSSFYSLYLSRYPPY